jgi:hypothetical protein
MAGMGIVQMTSLLSLNNKMTRMDTLGASRTELQGKLLTERDEARRERLQERLEATEQRIGETANEAQNRIEADREAIRAERAENQREMEYRIDAARENNRAETAEASQSGRPTISGESSEYVGTTDNAVTVEISMTARNAAASAPSKTPSTPSHGAAQSSEAVNVTV